jgi:hypothetical protein
MANRHGFFGLVKVFLASVQFMRAENASFDLSGSRVEVKVTWAGKALSVSQVPNLRLGDRLWVHPLFPPTSQAEF